MPVDVSLEAGVATTSLAADRAAAAAREAAGGDERAAARQFEALLLQELVEAMRQTIPKTGEDLPGQALLDGLQDQALAEHLAASGGIGLADLIVNDRSPARQVAPLSAQALLVPAPAPVDDGDLFASDGPEPAEPLGPADGRPLRDQLPPDTDPWLDAPDAHDQLRRLILGAPATLEPST